MVVGTTLSRITGVIRVIALTTVVGGAGFGDAYNLANTTPNIITDVVIGGVLSATFVPVFVDYLTTRRTKEAWEAISAVVTVTIAVLAALAQEPFVGHPVVRDVAIELQRRGLAVDRLLCELSLPVPDQRGQRL